MFISDDCIQAPPGAKAPKISESDKFQITDLYKSANLTFKIVDLGNACWTNKHFSEDIQTRQYRAPEVILGSGYDTSADIWSLACMAFELITGDYLFDPKGSDEYPRDEDHIALVIELLGDFPHHVLAKSKHFKSFFTKRRTLRHIKALRPWSLKEVLIQKYSMCVPEANVLSEFLEQMLVLDAKKRCSAHDLLKHKWLFSD